MGIDLLQPITNFISSLNKRAFNSPKISQIERQPESLGKSPSPRLKKIKRFLSFLGSNKKYEYEYENENEYEHEKEKDLEAAEEECGECVWRKGIIMGWKCDPLNFSGVIYYDNEGKRLNHVPPRSPRHLKSEGGSSLSSYSFPVAVAKDGGEESFRFRVN